MALEAGMAPAAGTALALSGCGNGTSRGDRDSSRDGTGTPGVGTAPAAGITQAAGTALTPPGRGDGIGSGDRDGISIPQSRDRAPAEPQSRCIGRVTRTGDSGRFGRQSQP